MKSRSVWCMLDEEGERANNSEELGVIVVGVVDVEEAEQMVADVCCGNSCKVVVVVRGLTVRGGEDICPGVVLRFV